MKQVASRVVRAAGPITWTRPNVDYEYEEIEYNPTLKGYFKDKANWETLARGGRVSSLDSAQLDHLENHDPVLEGLENEKIARAEEAFASGVVELPIVLKDGDFLYLLGGNTRIAYARKLEIPVNVWIVATPGLRKVLKLA